MQHHFSPSTNGFYSDAVHGPREIAKPRTKREQKAGKRPELVSNPDTRIPEDAVAITADRYAQLFAAQGEGKAIVARGGKPVAIDPVRDPAEHEAARRRQRDGLLAASDWTQLADAPLDPQAKADWATYRQALRDLDMAGQDWPASPNLENDEEAE